MEITHGHVATGTDAGTGEVHKDEWNQRHVIADSPDFPPTSPDAMDDEFPGSSLDGKWTIWNQQSGQSVAVSSSLVNLYSPSSYQARAYAILQTAPGGTWRVRAKLVGPDGPTWNYSGIGLIARRTTGGDKSVFVDLGFWHEQQCTFFQTALSGTSFASEIDLYNGNFPCYMELEYDGTNLVFRTSSSGVFFHQVWTGIAATYLGGAPEYVGINLHPYSQSNDGNNHQSYSADWFRRMA